MEKELLHIEPSPIKSNSSYGNWAVRCINKYTYNDGDGREMPDVQYFMRKTEAIAWINENRALVLPLPSIHNYKKNYLFARKQ